MGIRFGSYRFASHLLLFLSTSRLFLILHLLTSSHLTSSHLTSSHLTSSHLNSSRPTSRPIASDATGTWWANVVEDGLAISLQITTQQITRWQPPRVVICSIRSPRGGTAGFVGKMLRALRALAGSRQVL